MILRLNIKYHATYTMSPTNVCCCNRHRIAVIVTAIQMAQFEFSWAYGVLLGLTLDVWDSTTWLLALFSETPNLIFLNFISLCVYVCMHAHVWLYTRGCL